MRIIQFLLLFFFIILPGFSETIYVYTFEICDDEPVPCELQAKEGILDGLFEEGHVVFDDLTDSMHPNLLTEDQIHKLIMNARTVGAYYLVGAWIVSRIQVVAQKQRIESFVFYFLYDVSTGNLIQKGNIKVNNGNKDQLSNGTFWFQLGLNISDKLSQYI